MAITIFQQIDEKFEAPIKAFVDTGVSNLAAAVDAPFRVALLLYITLHGFAILRGAVQSPLMDFAWRSVKLAFLLALATKADTFNYYVTDLFLETLPKEVGNALAGSGATLTGSAFDKLLQSGFDAASKIFEEAGWTDPGPAFIAIIVMAATVIGAVPAYAVYLYAKMALALVIALGPLFIALGLFAPTRRMAEGWLGQVVNFVVLQILVTAALLLLVNVANGLTAANSASDVLLTALLFSVIFLLTAVIAMQLPEIASSLAAGGATLSVGLAAAAAGGATTLGVKAARAAAGGTARAIGSRTKRLQSRLGDS